MEDKKSNNNNLFKKNLILVIIVIVIAVVPLVFMNKADFSGSDDKAEAEITKIDKNYKPWFSSIWKPPSAEIESLLFSLQAAVGAGVIGYYFGYQKGKSNNNKSKQL